MEHLLVTRRYLDVIEVSQLIIGVAPAPSSLQFSPGVATHTLPLAHSNIRSTAIPFNCTLLRPYLRHFDIS